MAKDKEIKEKRSRGRPLKFESPEQLQEAIEKYYKDCEAKAVLNKDGEQMIDKYGKPIYTDEKPLTMTGLALALNIDRKTLLNYEKKDDNNGDYFPIISRARDTVTAYAERRLFDRDGANGAKFWLANNDRWSDKAEMSPNDMEITIKVVK